MIKMQNVRKVYPGFDFELSMEIPEGRITGLIGKNGAGKSTAIRLNEDRPALIFGRVFAQQVENLISRFHIESCGRLVEDQKLCLV